jgi:hypothetical protein
MNRSNLIIGGVILAIVGALAIRAWWYWPKELHGGPHLEKIEKRGRDYSLHLKTESSLSDIVSLGIFEGYCPSNHLEFEERMADRSSKFVKDEDHHHYVEYMAKHGRMQFHSGFHEEAGISKWLEFVPTDLPVDSFLSENVAINLDLNQPEFRVYIPLKRNHMYMTVFVKNRKVDRIAWLDY